MTSILFQSLHGYDEMVKKSTQNGLRWDIANNIETFVVLTLVL